jgi:uncharacterized membrane protein
MPPPTCLVSAPEPATSTLGKTALRDPHRTLVWAELNRGTGGALSVRGALAAMTDKQTY